MREFGAALPAIRELLDTDVLAAYRGDPAARSVDEVLLCYPGVAAMIHHRLANVLYRLGVPMLARIVAEIAHADTGIDIHPGARIGSHFFIDHGTGVVIGETAVIGRNVRIYQAVTLGAKRFAIGADGQLEKGGARHPIVEDDVVIYAGATVLGRVTIGRGASIGGNVWLTHSVPPGSRIAQANALDDRIPVDERPRMRTRSMTASSLPRAWVAEDGPPAFRTIRRGDPPVAQVARLVAGAPRRRCEPQSVLHGRDRACACDAHAGDGSEKLAQALEVTLSSS